MGDVFVRLNQKTVAGYWCILLHTLQPEALLLNDLCREMEECVMPSAEMLPVPDAISDSTPVD